MHNGIGKQDLLKACVLPYEFIEPYERSGSPLVGTGSAYFGQRDRRNWATP